MDTVTSMKIAYCGNFDPAHSTETHLRETLMMLGHEVIPIHENRASAEEVAKIAASADLFLWTRTWGLRGDGRGLLANLKCPSVAYHLDLYAGLQREELVRTDPWWRCKYVFTPDGGSEDFWQRNNVNHFWIRPGVFQPECYMADRPNGFRHDVVFVGSYGYHPEWPYRPRLIEWLGKTYGSRFVRYGGEGPYHVGAARGDKLNRVYAESKVVVGDTLCLGFRHTRYWSDRVYETLGRGGFLIHPWIEGLQEEFDDGVHLRYYSYGEFEQLKRLIDYYLEHDSEREKIRQIGHEKVKSYCTYTNRMLQMLSIVGIHESGISEKI